MNQTKNTSALIRLTSAVLLFGTIGLFRTWSGLPSGLLSMTRGLIGAAFLYAVMLLAGKHISFSAIRKSLPLLILSGAMIGANWILLFEAYNYTTVPIATLCYYMAPVFVILASPLVLKERLTGTRLLCTGIALVGIILVVFGSDDGASDGKNHLIGILCGLGAAALYGGDILINKVVEGVTAEERTFVQLFTAGLVCIPYTFLCEDLGSVEWTGAGIALMLVMGIVHTGIAYTLYFGSMKQLPAQTVALLSYVDPVASVILAVWLLPGSVLTAAGWIGAVLVLGAALLSELPHKEK